MAGKVLIVDDDADLMRLLVAGFKAKGFEVKSFLKGKEALSYLQNETEAKSLSLLILDRILPDMDGIEILRFFIEKYKGIVPVLILSTLSAEKDVLEGLKKGAVDYVSKPFSLPILMQKALALMNRSQ